MEEGAKKGREPPDWYVDEPEILPGEGFYLRAFWSLSTERSVGQVLGWIPWSRAIDYASKAGLDADMIGPFWTIIHLMDGGYMEWQSNEYKRSARSMEGGGVKKPVPGGDRKVKRRAGGRRR